MNNKLKDELQNVLSGKSEVRFGKTIQAISGYLNRSSSASRATENSKSFKEQETARLEQYISQNDFWITEIDFSKYVSEGAEQKVYLKSPDHVLKLNDSIYYASWRDYLYNLLLHNYFFSDTAYQLIGFTKYDSVLYAVVEQAYVSITGNTNLRDVRQFLISNGFENTRNNDYYHKDLGIILEDLHDENVLTKNDLLYFIDTVFYITDNFWERT